MGKVKWTEKASSNLHAIHDYIAKDSKTYAARFIKSLIRATTKLERMPRCGRMVSELEGYGFREVVFQNYRIVYMLVEGSDDVEILAVVHSAREINKVVRKEWELN